MIKLKDLSHCQRVYLARQSEPFFLAYTKTKQLTSSYLAIINALNVLIEDPEYYSKEIWTVISAVAQAIKYNSKYFELSLDNENYATANKITNQKISPVRMRTLLSSLEELNLLTVYKGFYIPSEDKSVDSTMKTVIHISEELLSFFDVTLCNLFGKSREYDLVVLKDKDGAIVSTKGLRGISNEKQLLKDMNKIIENSVICIENQVVSNIVYKAVFHNDLAGGGRLYAGAFTTEKSVLRKTITINNSTTCEIDYKNNHVRILYNKYSIDYQEDAYALAIPGYDIKELRSAAKLAMLICLNAKNKQQALKSLSEKLSNTEEYPSITNSDKASKEILSALELKHDLISGHFYKAEWAQLQHLDSNMAKHIIKHFNVLNKVVLCYHDSFLVKTEDFELLKQSMEEAWCQVLGSHHGFAIDIEFCNTVGEK